jgi:hypothetical protein
MVLEADFVLAESYLVRREVEVAGADGVEVTYHRHGGVRHPHVGIRTEAYRAIVGRAALDTDAGEGFVADDDLGIGLVVLEQDIVAWLVLLDEGVLEDESFGLGAYDYILYTTNLAHQEAGLRAGDIPLEVAADTPTEVLRLSHVDDVPFLPDVLVATGGFGEGGEDLAYFVERHRVLGL